MQSNSIVYLPYASTRRVARFGALVVMFSSLLVAGCATQQQTGTAIGGLLGVAVGVAAGSGGDRSDRGKRQLIGALVGGGIGAFAGSAIGSRLDAADQQRAEAAARQAMAERDAAVQRAVAMRNAEIEAQLRNDLAQARTAQARAESERRAAEARAVAQQTAAAQPTAPVVWQGNDRGSAQAVGPAAYGNRRDCQQVREVAFQAGKEIKQIATFCPDATGKPARVA